MSSDYDINVETDGFEEALTSLAVLPGFISNETSEAVDDEVEQLLRLIRQKIQRKGLIGTDRVKEVPLLLSFDSQKSGMNNWTVYSTSEYSEALEVGADPHPIEPDDADVLAFQPDNPSEYEPEPGVDDDGYVYLGGVSHPGNDAYRYVFESQVQWVPFLSVELDSALDRAIRKSGFSRDSTGTGGAPSGIGGPDFIDG